jgi:hypothetical protein
VTRGDLNTGLLPAWLDTLGGEGNLHIPPRFEHKELAAIEETGAGQNATMAFPLHGSFFPDYLIRKKASDHANSDSQTASTNKNLQGL